MAVVLNLSFVKNPVTTLEVEVQILLRVRKEHNLPAAMFTDIILPILDEFGAKADALHRGVNGQ